MAQDAIHRSWEVDDQIVYYHGSFSGDGAAGVANEEGAAVTIAKGAGTGAYSVTLDDPSGYARPVDILAVHATIEDRNGALTLSTYVVHPYSINQATRTILFKVTDTGSDAAAPALDDLGTGRTIHFTIVTRKSLAAQ